MQFFSDVKNNWESGLIVTLVSISLSISPAVAAKFPLFLNDSYRDRYNHSHL